LYIPMWSARQIVGEVANPEQTYVLVAEKLFSSFSPGMIGLFVSAIFAATMSMISADLNSLASVFTKDIFQRTMNKNSSDKTLLKVGMISTIAIGVLTIGSAIFTIQLHGAFNAMVEWYAAILGPISVPLLFGMVYKKATWRGAIASWALGFLTFIIIKYGYALITGSETPFALYTGAELAVSFGVFFVEGYLNKQTSQEKQDVDELFLQIK
jgi:SSS family solute:Na+ symporter